MVQDFFHQQYVSSLEGISYMDGILYGSKGFDGPAASTNGKARQAKSAAWLQ